MSLRSTEVAVVGGGIAGMSTAARLQAAGLETVVLEQHDHVGGCAGYYRTDGFSFDVGATTLVDFRPGGVGGQLLADIGLEPPDITIQDAYEVWLPDRRVTLYHDREKWREERAEKLGNSDRHRAFYAFIDDLAETYWRITRDGVKLPVQTPGDLVRNLRAMQIGDLLSLRYLRWTMADAMSAYGVDDETALGHVIAMLVEDTVHTTLEEAPLINAVLGSTIRRAGIGRATGGMYGFWQAFEDHYEDLGGTVMNGTTVTEITGTEGRFHVRTDRNDYRAEQVVSSLPINLTKQIAPSIVGTRLDRHISMMEAHEGGSVVVFLGVPEHEVDDHEITHHQVLPAYDEPLGDGNNMFITVSAPGDTVSAPEGYRAVMLSTHCDVEPWQDLTPESYEQRKNEMRDRLIEIARTVYPDLASDPAVCEVGTPVTYESFTNRPRGAVGGYRQTMRNTNQNAVPQDIGIDGFYLAGDTTWPGLGTVACIIGSEIAAEHVMA
ncbi:phytoene desaturase family protein [Natronobacterium texcoconense]|uniref:C-3',4' desaturase CrtD n=1 Tax=Natronobacterium texcoconense TaxID=1095778 RepID=A0A1H1HZU1_NATTX|nr:NAD(P)/FAD-dependent oxidoreductase [Natronobacterium texcoconense]SDR30964.1 C-3',4' desaturase CrtD [Natronobacterium texcoconense]